MFLGGTGARTAASCSVLSQAFLQLPFTSFLFSSRSSSPSSSPRLSLLSAFSRGGVLRSRYGASLSSLPREPTRFDVLVSWISYLSHLSAPFWSFLRKPEVSLLSGFVLFGRNFSLRSCRFDFRDRAAGHCGREQIPDCILLS